jgi:5-methylcytosine-specific restriction endonuclease McrA
MLYTVMDEPSVVPTDLSDSELVAEVSRLAASERRATATLVSALAELDARRLYLGEGCSSMFTYCTQVLHLAEHAAYNRIEAARAARRFPLILTLLADGRVHLSAVRLLAPHLTDENHRDVLCEASHKSKRAIEEIVARLQPRPDVSPSVRKQPSMRPPLPPTPAAIEESLPPEAKAEPVAIPTAPRAKVEPLAPGRYKVQFTITRETWDKLRRVQDLLRHSVPAGDPAAIFDRALTLLLDHLEKKKIAVTDRPRTCRVIGKHSRSVPANVRRAVWSRDGGRCKFEGNAGRCRETGRLEFHHIVPYALGGETTVQNLELRCASHNRYDAEQCFGVFVREDRPQCSWM